MAFFIDFSVHSYFLHNSKLHFFLLHMEYFILQDLLVLTFKMFFRKMITKTGHGVPSDEQIFCWLNDKPLIHFCA